MKQKNETPIIEKFSKLYEACSRYPKVVLCTGGNKPEIYKEPQGYAQDGFIKNFCK